jgi:squalene-hopene cyclase-like protein
MTMKPWLRALRFDPRPALLGSTSAPVQFFTRRDLLGASAGPVEALWQSQAVSRLVARQLPSGAWRYPAPRTRLRSVVDYDQIETFRVLSDLVEKHGLHKGHAAIRRAARYVLSHQSADGDIRGIYGHQYSPNYTAGFLELLSKAGLGSNPPVRRAFRWLLAVRQDDGGWAIPLRTAGGTYQANTLRAATIQPIRSKRSSHLVTGVVLRALAAHPQYQHSPAARTAGVLLASRLFKPDAYPDRRTTAFWTHFTYPFWFTDLVSALDSLSLVGFSRKDPSIARALNWFVTRQHRSGLWTLPMMRGANELARHDWLTLAICRVFKRFFD